MAKVMPNRAPRMRGREGNRALHALAFVFLAILALVELLPFLWMFLSGFKSTREMLLDPFAMPDVWKIENYLTAWRSGVSRYFVNSIFTTIAATVLCVAVSSMLAYPLARFRFRLNRVLLMFVLSGMMLAPMVSLIPLYKILSFLGLYDTRLALIIPYVAFRIPFSTFLIWSHFVTIPREIEEAAIIDGCSSLRVLLQVMLPLSKPMLATTALLCARYVWNEMMFALCFIETTAIKTIPVGLLALKGQESGEWSVLVAGLALSTIPIVILYLIFQKQLVRGMMMGSVKG